MTFVMSLQPTGAVGEQRQKPLKRKDAKTQRFLLLKLRDLAQFGINGRLAAVKKSFDGERPRVSSRLKGF
jgi:hypothetical protein